MFDVSHARCRSRLCDHVCRSALGLTVRVSVLLIASRRIRGRGRVLWSRGSYDCFGLEPFSSMFLLEALPGSDFIAVV